MTQSGINIFANGLSTRTYGGEFVVTYSSDFDEWGHVDWTASGSYNKTKVTSVKGSPRQIAPQTLYDTTAISILEDATPKYRLILAALWSIHGFNVNLRETLNGSASERNVGDDGVLYKSKIDPTPITDLEVAYTFHRNIRVAVGANNLFDQFPDKLNPGLLASYLKANDNAYVGRYPDFSPFGINGGYYYGRVTYTF